MEPLIKAKDLAKLLNVNTYTVYRLTKEGKIPCIRFAGTIRYSKEKINKWLEEEAKS